MHHAGRTLIASITALTLVACGGSTSTIVRVPASELPALGRSTIPEDPPLTTVTTIDGSKHTLNGAIQRVELDMKNNAVLIAPPFQARIQGEDLQVLTDKVRTYHVPDISYASVQYGGETASRVPPRRRNIGTGLIIGGLIPLALGTGLIVEDLGCSGGGLSFCGLGTVFGGGLALIGAGLFIAGVSVYNSAPSTPQTKFVLIRPKLQLSPTSGTFSFEF